MQAQAQYSGYGAHQQAQTLSTQMQQQQGQPQTPLGWQGSHSQCTSQELQARVTQTWTQPQHHQPQHHQPQQPPSIVEVYNGWANGITIPETFASDSRRLEIFTLAFQLKKLHDGTFTPIESCNSWAQQGGILHELKRLCGTVRALLTVDWWKSLFPSSLNNKDSIGYRLWFFENWPEFYA